MSVNNKFEKCIRFLDSIFKVISNEGVRNFGRKEKKKYKMIIEIIWVIFFFLFIIVLICLIDICMFLVYFLFMSRELI